MTRKKTTDRPWVAKLDKPCVLRTDIIKEAAVKSGLADVIDIKLIDAFLQCYKQLLDEYAKSGNLIF